MATILWAICAFLAVIAAAAMTYWLGHMHGYDNGKEEGYMHGYTDAHADWDEVTHG